MHTTSTRLTLYAIISSIELDLRDLIDEYCGQTGHSQSILGDEVHSKCLGRWKGEGNDGEPSLRALLDYADLGEEYAILHRHIDRLPEHAATAIKDAQAWMETLLGVRNRVMHARPLQTQDLPHTVDLAIALAAAPTGCWTRLSGTLAKIEADPSWPLSLRLPVLPEPTRVCHNLPLPDFDETGFVGRQHELRQLLKHCQGPYPVITVVGEGGVGKTALALQAAFSLLDSPEPTFEAVVWVSCKTKTFVGAELRRISGAINSSLGMFQAVTHQFGAAASASRDEATIVGEVLDALESFKVLLVIDNLETVLDERVRDFVERIPLGSKILITSRIGLGAYEVPLRLGAMGEAEATKLLRALAVSRGQRDLAAASGDVLLGYCRRLKCNPGFLKWFLSCVQSGRRPEEAIQNTDEYYDFCMSNVYEFLPVEARQLLHVLLVVPGRLSHAELSYLGDLSALNTRRALQELLAASMVHLRTAATGETLASQYEMAELARGYLTRHHRPGSDRVEDVLRRRQQLVSGSEEIEAGLDADPYDVRNVCVRSDGDKAVACYLVRALRLSRRGAYDEAFRVFDEAMDLAPEYFEVHRVRAFVLAESHDVVSARDEYEAAIDLEPNWAPLRFLYGGFLLRWLDDTKGAIEQLDIARRLDPKEARIRIEKARALIYARQFDEAVPLVNEVLADPDLGERDRVRAHDLHLQIHSREAEWLCVQRGELAAALLAVESLKSAFENIPEQLIDNLMRQKLAGTSYVARRLASNANDEPTRQRADVLAEWLRATSLGSPGESESQDRRPEIAGRVLRLVRKTPSFGFGFVETDSGELYFNSYGMRYPRQWSSVRVGAHLRGRLSANDGGPCLDDVRLAASGEQAPET